MTARAESFATSATVPAVFRAKQLLDANGTLTAKQLALRMDIDAERAGKLLRQLAAQGHAERRPAVGRRCTFRTRS